MSRLFEGPDTREDDRRIAAEAPDEFNLAPYLEILRRRWRIPAIVVALCLAAALFHYFTTPKSFLATARIQIERRSLTAAAGEFNPWLEGYWGMDFYPTQYELLRSRGLAERVVEQLRLWENRDFYPATRTLASADSGEPATAGADRAMLRSLASRLLGGLEIRPIRDTQLVNISYVAPTPELAADVANGFAEAYIAMGLSTRSAEAGRATEFLDEEIAGLRQQIDDKQAEIETYQRQLRRSGLENPATEVSSNRLAQLNADHTAAVNARIAASARLNRLLDTPDRQLVDLNAGSIGALRNTMLEDERQYDANLKIYKPDWPAMVELRQKIENGRQELDQLIAEEADRIRAAARSEYHAALASEQALAGEIDRATSATLEVRSAATDYNTLVRELESLQAELAEKQQRRLTVGSASRLQQLGESNVRIIDEAVVPGGPFRPSLRRDFIFGLGLGVLFGLGLAYLVEYLDRTIKTSEQLERLLGLPVLAVIPDVSFRAAGYGYGARGKEAGRTVWSRIQRSRAHPDTDQASADLLPHRQPRHVASEAYRGLRTALLLSTAEELDTVAVTSARTEEGKSTTAVNLGVVLGQLGRRVVIVDADLRRPRLHRIFDAPNRVGLVSCLAGGADIGDVVQETDVPSVWLVPSGPIPPNPSELLASRRMDAVLAQLRERFDHVILDTPPVLAVTDSTVLGSRATGVVLCLRSGKVLREDARDCVDRLRLADVRVLGTVLNGFRPQVGYGRGYQRYYEAYLESDPSAADSAA